MSVVYLLKEGRIYNISEGSALPTQMDEVSGDYQIVIDDSYFFYVSVGKMNLSRKKIRQVAENYLQSVFPLDLFAGMALFENKNDYTAMVYKEPLADMIQSNFAFFRQARKISTAFCELVVRYNDFIFSDGTRNYMKSGTSLEILSSASDEALRADDLWDELIPLKASIELPGVQKDRGPIRGWVSAAVVVGVCYLIFLASNIVTLMADKKVEQELEERLNGYYTQANVADKPDPYGTLLSMAQRTIIAPFRVINVLNDLGGAIPTDIKVDSLTVGERTARFEGFAGDFAAVETLKNDLDTKLKKQTTLDDSRQVEGQIKFIIRYDP